jgi:hypothetical protein
MPSRHPHLATCAVRLLILGALVATLAGCQSIAGIQPVSQVRVIDTSPDAPPLDIHQNANAALYNIGFGTVSSYFAVNPGAYTHAAYTAGTQQQLASVRGVLSTGNQYTVLAGNTAASLQMSLLKDQSFPAPTGQIALRFLDQTTRPGAVDIYLLPPGAAPITVSPVVTAATFGSNSGYLNLPAGTYSILAYPTGAIPGATSPFYTGSQVVYPAGSAHTILLIDEQPPTHSLQIISAADFDPSAS